MSLEILTLDALYDEPEAPWLVENLIIDGGFFQITAAPKSGKSMFTLDLAFSVSLGEQFLGWNTTQRPVVLVNFEDGKRRVGARMRSAFKLTKGSSAPIRAAFGIDDKASFDELLGNLREEGRPVLLILDPLVEIFGRHGVVDENSSTQVAPVLRKLRKFCEDTKSTIVIVHHTTKSGSGTRGSSAIDGAVDGWMQMTRAKDRSTILLSCDPTLRDDGFESSFDVEFDPNQQPRPKFVRMDAPVATLNHSKKPRVDPVAVVAAAILDALQVFGPLNVKTLTEKIGIGSKSKGYKEAVDRLVENGRIEWVGSTTHGEWHLLPVSDAQAPTVVDSSVPRPSPTGEGTNEPNDPTAPLSGASLPPDAVLVLEGEATPLAATTTAPSTRLNYEVTFLPGFDVENDDLERDEDDNAA